MESNEGPPLLGAGQQLRFQRPLVDGDAWAHRGAQANFLQIYTLGCSRLIAQPGTPARVAGWRERGLRYMTVQIFDCDGMTSALERAGVEIGMAPKTVGQVRYSFIRDPDGNWIELSERASLTGKPVPTG